MTTAGGRRLFVAVELPDDARGWLHERVSGWRTELPGWRWSDPATWHVTLAFLGSVDPAVVPDLSERLARVAARAAPFQAWLAGRGAFSRPARATVLWIGVDQAEDAADAHPGRTGRGRAGRTPLGALADSVTAAGRRAGIAVEESRRYRPHVTLGRRRDPVDLRPTLARSAGADTPSADWRVDDFVLVESHLGASVRHEQVERFPFGG